MGPMTLDNLDILEEEDEEDVVGVGVKRSFMRPVGIFLVVYLKLFFTLIFFTRLAASKAVVSA